MRVYGMPRITIEFAMLRKEKDDLTSKSYALQTNTERKQTCIVPNINNADVLQAD